MAKRASTIARRPARTTRLLEDAEDPAAVLERAASVLPSSMRAAVFAVVADLRLGGLPSARSAGALFLS